MMQREELSSHAQERIDMFMTVRRVVLLVALWGALGCSVAETRSQNRATQAENRQLYEIYQQYMQSQNAQREMSGIPPRPIQPYEEWQKSPGTD
jgi:hypothetical protein